MLTEINGIITNSSKFLRVEIGQRCLCLEIPLPGWTNKFSTSLEWLDNLQIHLN